MPAPEQIVFPAVPVLGIARVDPRTDDLVPFDGPNVVPEQVGPNTPDQRDPLELVVGCERRERPNRAPGAGRVMRGRPRIFIEESADLLGHGQPGPSLGAVPGVELERRGLAAHDSGDGGVALLGPVDASAVPRPGGWPRRAAPDVFELPRRDVRAARGVTHPLHRGRVDGATSISPAVGVEGIGLQIVHRVNQRGRRQARRVGRRLTPGFGVVRSR